MEHLEGNAELIALDNDLDDAFLEEELEEDLREVRAHTVDILNSESLVLMVLSLHTMDKRADDLQARLHYVILKIMLPKTDLTDVEEAAQ